MKTKKSKHELEQIPGIGTRMAGELAELGYTTVEALKNQDPQKMYDKLCEQKGYLVDRCVLYVFRCAVYYASNEFLEPEKLKWWNWKD